MELLLRAGAAYLFQDQFKRLNDHIDDNIRSPDKRRPIGSKSTLNGKPVYWSGENYGWQSEGSYNKLKEGPEFRAGHIAASRIGTDINQAISTGFNALPEPVKQTTKDVAKAAVDTYQSLPDPVKQGVSSAVNFVGDVNEGISKATNISPIITEEVAQTALTFGAGKLAFEGGKAGLKFGVRQTLLNLPAETAYALHVKDAPAGLARAKGVRGSNRVVTSFDRKIERLVAENVDFDQLKNRPKNTALATNYDISDQDLFQGRYAKSRDVKAQSHHALDQELFGMAFDGPDGAEVRNIANKHNYRFGNDAFNMADVPGYIVGSDHQAYFHGKVYRQLPARRAIYDAIKDGSYYRYSPKYRAKLVIAAADESQQSVLRWAKWKLSLMEDKYPAMKKMNAKQKRMFINQFKDEFQSIGAGQQPSVEKLMSGRRVHLNDDLRKVFGIEFGSRPSSLSHPIPAKHRRRADGKIGTY